MRLSTLLSKHLTNAANIQKSNSINYFNLYATVWKVRIFEGTPAIRNFGKKSVTNQKRWQISKNDLRRFDLQFSVESKNEIKLGRFHLKKHNFNIFIIQGVPELAPQRKQACADNKRDSKLTKINFLPAQITEL
jgi:hypothetical protein